MLLCNFMWRCVVLLSLGCVCALTQDRKALVDELIGKSGAAERQAWIDRNKSIIDAEFLAAINVRAGEVATKGGVDESIALYRTSLAAARLIGNKRLAIIAEFGIGTQTREQGNAAQAMEIFRKCLAAALEADEKSLAANILNSMGQSLTREGSYELAIESSKRAVMLAEESGDRQRIAQTSFTLGNSYIRSNDLREALRALTRSLEICEALGLESRIGLIANSIGNIYLRQRDYELALEYYQRSLAIKRKLGTPSEISHTLGNLGLLHEYLGKLDQARTEYEDSLNLINTTRDEEGKAIALHDYGLLLRKQGKIIEAAARLEESLKVSTATGDLAMAAETNVRLAEMDFDAGRRTQALERVRSSLEIGRRVGYEELLRIACIPYARALRGDGRNAEARAVLEDGVAGVERFRAGIAGGAEQQQRAFEDELLPYQDLFDLLADTGHPAEALDVAERAKARVLLDYIGAGGSRVTKTMTQAEQQRENSLLLQIANLTAQLRSEGSRPNAAPSRIAELKTGMAKARSAYRDFQTALYVAHPELQGRRGDVAPITADELKRVLGPNTAAIEYIFTDTGLRAATVRTDVPGCGSPCVRVYKLAPHVKELQAKVQRFQKQLSARDLGYRAAAEELYTMLVAPVLKDVKGVASLILVPDGVLWQLPFQALAARTGGHLLERYALSYAPSLTTLREMTRGGTNPSHRVLAVASAGSQAAGREHEAHAIAALYGTGDSEVYTGVDATAAHIRSQGQQFGMLHLASHGFYDDRDAMYSYVEIPRGSTQDGTAPGWLDAKEIMTLDLKANLVVLSACETARGRVGRGEGLIGMSWAFFVAGASTVVASQWKVDADATTDLMVRFYRGMLAANHPSKAQALRQAAMLLMKTPRYRHPYYWAGFVAVGDALLRPACRRLITCCRVTRYAQALRNRKIV